MPTYFPGLLISVTVALAAGYISDHYGGPTLLFALLLGIAFNFLSQGGPVSPGIDVAARSVLRVGVALLGFRVSFQELLALGTAPLYLVIAAILCTVAAGFLFGSLLGLRREFALLSGCAVAICGASAALAVATAIPRQRLDEKEVLFVVVGVTTLSTVAMVLYPIIIALAGLDAVQAGIFLGGTIHDVAQVVGAGYMISNEVGDVATVIKLLRVASLPLAIFLIALWFREKESKLRDSVPLFLVGFLSCVLLNNLDIVPEVIHQGLVEVSRWCLVVAIAALGMKTCLKELAKLGGSAVILMVVETMALAILVLVTIKTLGT